MDGPPFGGVYQPDQSKYTISENMSPSWR
jgi:hypothetical protein